AIPEVNPVVPELNQVVDIHDPNEMVDIPNDIDFVDYDEEDPEKDPEEDPEEEPEEDVDIELNDDAELIFPYEVEGDKTSPPGDVSSDSESEDEEVEESSSARDSSHVDGLALWALRRDLQASRAQARIMEAELGTCQTEIALLKSKNKITEKERELLNHDLENVERALGNVLERVPVLESEENATWKKDWLRLRLSWRGLVWNVIPLRGGCMSPECRIRCSTWIWIMPPKAMSEARMREIIRDQAASMLKFMANMKPRSRWVMMPWCGADGAGGLVVLEQVVMEPVVGGWCDPQPFKGTEGAVGLCQWFEKLESMFRISDFKEMDKVKFATTTLQCRALTCGMEGLASWQRLEQELYNLKLKGTNIDWYTNRFHELDLLCPRMMDPEQVKVEQYIRGLSKNIRGDVTSSRPTGIDEAIRMAYQLMEKIIQDMTDEALRVKEEKVQGDRVVAQNAACWSLDRKDVTCFNCNEKGHRKRDFPKLKNNGQGGNNRGAIYKLGAVDDQQDPKVVIGVVPMQLQELLEKGVLTGARHRGGALGLFND
ncbi:putative reverse transcriptase domain-containing protein, partial [Tanacetum coccineum]